MKGYVRCMWLTEGCMIERYAMEVSMGFLIEYIQDFWAMTQKVWDAEEEEGISGEVLEGASFRVDLDLAKWGIVHHYVITNTTAMANWVK